MRAKDGRLPPSDRVGECPSPSRNEISGLYRPRPERSTGEESGEGDLDSIGECGSSCGAPSKGSAEKSGGVLGVGSNTIAGIPVKVSPSVLAEDWHYHSPSASAFSVRRLSSREAKKRLRAQIVRNKPRTLSRLTRSVTRSVLTLRMSRSSNLANQLTPSYILLC